MMKKTVMMTIREEVLRKFKSLGLNISQVANNLILKSDVAEINRCYKYKKQSFYLSEQAVDMLNAIPNRSRSKVVDDLLSDYVNDTNRTFQGMNIIFPRNYVRMMNKFLDRHPEATGVVTPLDEQELLR